MTELTRQEKYRASMIRKYGSEEAWKQAMKDHGNKARRDTPRGFSRMSPEQIQEISRLGVEARKRKIT